jgi:hypothetical protein
MSDNDTDEVWTQDGFMSDDDFGSMDTTNDDEEDEPVLPNDENPRAFAENLVRYAEENHRVLQAIDIAVQTILSDQPATVVHSLPQALVHADIDSVDLFSLTLAETTRFSNVNLHAMVHALKKRMPCVKN